MSVSHAYLSTVNVSPRNVSTSEFVSGNLLKPAGVKGRCPTRHTSNIVKELKAQ